MFKQLLKQWLSIYPNIQYTTSLAETNKVLELMEQTSQMLQNPENVAENVANTESQHSTEELVIGTLLEVMKELYMDNQADQRDWYMNIVNQALNYLGVHSYDDDVDHIHQSGKKVEE